MIALRLAILPAMLLAAAGTACVARTNDRTSTDASTTQTPAADCPRAETRPPNAGEQRPAFPGQTRACLVRSDEAFDVVVLARGLEHPWTIEPLPGGDLLITERPGRMRIVSAGGTVGPPIAGLPAVDARGQGGLLDAALSPDFANDRTIFWSYAERRQSGNGTAVARGVLSPDRSRLDDVRVIFRVMPTYDGTMHFGSRLVFGPDGMLFVTTGERSDREMRMHAQRLDNHLGKVLRITPDGAAPPNNPFVGREGALPEIWSYGHRNIQAATLDRQGRLWIVDHGPRGGDKLVRPEPGTNHGWPVVTYGIEYSGQPIAGAVTAREGFEQPVYYWDPSPAPSGAQFYTGDAFPGWRDNLFVGALAAQRLIRLVIENGRVTGEEHLLVDRGQRVRDVRQGLDGTLYVVTDEENGEILRIVPRP